MEGNSKIIKEWLLNLLHSYLGTKPTAIAMLEDKWQSRWKTATHRKKTQLLQKYNCIFM